MFSYLLMFYVLVWCPSLGYLNRKSDPVLFYLSQEERTNVVAIYFMCASHGVCVTYELVCKGASKLFNKWRD